MRHQLTAYLDDAIMLLLLVLGGLTPLFFLNQTTEFYEMPKLILLMVVTILLYGLWIFSWIVKGKIVITRTPLDIPLLFLLGVVLVSTFFSSTKYAAIYGNFPTVHGSAVSWVTYILLYFVTVSNLKNIAQIKAFLYTLYGSGVVVALLTILSFFNIFLPFDFAKVANFTPTGSSFSTIAFLLLLLPLPLLSIINKNRFMPLPAALVLSILFGITIVLTGSISSYVALVIAFGLCIFASKHRQIRNSLPLFAIPVVVLLLTLALAYWKLPGNPLQNLENNFPKEVQLPFAISWKVTASAFRDAPLVGTGPSTYLFNFTTYKPVEFNLLNFWNFGFNSPYNEFLQALGTLGILGLSALLIICLTILKISWRNITISNTEEHHESPHVTLTALAVSGLLAIVLLAIHATTLVSIVATFFVLAVLMASQKSIREKVMEFSMGIKASTLERQFDLFPIIVFVVFLVAAIPVLYKTFNAVAADYYHRKALSSASQNGSLTYRYLQRAEALNPVIDLYRVDMAQTNFALANALAAQKGPSTSNPKGSLTDQDKQTIQTLLSQSINEGRASVTINPRSARNWEVLASIYRNINGVAKNALLFALDAYGQAIQRDPVNPGLRVSVGGIYYAAKNYDLAIRFFSDAANLKPDYANAYFNLAIALRDKGDLQNALVVAQQAQALLQKNPNSQDYKIVSLLIDDLKKKVANASAQGGQTPEVTPTPTGTQTNSALQNSKVGNVNVSNLNNPPSVTPPPAVKTNPNTNLPITPQPTKKP